MFLLRRPAHSPTGVSHVPVGDCLETQVYSRGPAAGYMSCRPTPNPWLGQTDSSSSVFMGVCLCAGNHRVIMVPTAINF